MIYDKDIREPLFDYLEEKYGKIRTIEEKRMGKSRADVVLILEDCVCGIEIKSDADTYARLSRQVKDYEQYFDRNIVVVGSTHAVGVREHIPDWWGIISVEEQEPLDFYVVREPMENPNRDLIKKLSILWRPELAHIQQINEMPAYKQKSKAFVIEKIAERVPEKISMETLQNQISQELFERDYNAIADTIDAYRIENGKKKKRKTAKRKRKYKVL